MHDLELYKWIDKICKPITTYLPIEIVSYVRFFPDGTRFCLSNSPNFIQHFVKDFDYFRSVPNPIMAEGLNSMVRIADVNALIVTTDSRLKDLYTNMMADGVGIFKVQPPYSILVSKPGYFEEFSFFPSSTYRGAYEKLIVNYEALRHFMFYFIDQTSDLMRHATLHRYLNRELTTPSEEKVSDLCLQAMNTKKYYFDSNTYLTKREAHCAYFITKNYSASQIADMMGISNRTVEDYIHNIKLKSQVSNIHQLQDFLCRAGFDRMIEFQDKKTSILI